MYLQEHLYISFSCFFSLQGRVVTFLMQIVNLNEFVIFHKKMLVQIVKRHFLFLIKLQEYCVENNNQYFEHLLYVKCYLLTHHVLIHLILSKNLLLLVFLTYKKLKQRSSVLCPSPLIWCKTQDSGSGRGLVQQRPSSCFATLKRVSGYKCRACGLL